MKYLFLLTLLFTLTAQAKTLRVAIVDTGLDLSDERFSEHLCPEGHKDFSASGIKDTVGHGTFIAGLIQKYAGKGNYCFLVYKYYSENAPGFVNVENEVSALREAVNSGATIVNFSAGGSIFDEQEYLIIKTNPQITFVVAAGNEGKNLDLSKNKYYPASYFLKNEVIVANVDSNGKRSVRSNWSDKAVEEVGENVKSTMPNYATGYMTGTSMSTAVRTGKIIRKTLDAAK